MAGAIDIPLHPKQYQVLDWAESDWSGWIGIGGGRGAAKSRGADSVALTLAYAQKRIVSCVVMRNFDQVRKYHIEPILRTWPKLQEYYKVSTAKLTIPSTCSEIDFSYAENLPDVERRFRSANYKYIIVDQAEQFVEPELREMKNACRWPGGGAKMILLFNMGGAGIQTLRKWFHAKEFNEHEDPNSFRFLHVYPWDNVEWSRDALAADGLTDVDYYSWSDKERFDYFVTRSDYGKSLNSLDPALRNRDLLGSWESLEGAYFGRVFDRQATMIDATQVNRILKPWSTRWISQDWGKSHYCATFWHGINILSPSEVFEILGWQVSKPLRVVVTYRRKIVSELDSTQVGQDIVKATPEGERSKIESYWLSPDAFGERDSSNTIALNQAKELRAAGLPEPEPADTDRPGGWMLMYEMLGNTKAKGTSGDLVWLISAECPELLESIPVLMRDPRDLDVVLKTDKGMARLEQDVSESCFVAGTPITTMHGGVPIERIQKGDMVLTRNGWKPVANSWMAKRAAQVVKATFSDGSTVTCTPDHRFWTERGFIPIESVRYGEKLISCKPFNSMAKHSQLGKMDIMRVEADSCTAKYGKGIMVQSLPKCIFITETVLQKALHVLTTLSVSHLNSIFQFMQRLGDDRQKNKLSDSSRLPENGIGLKGDTGFTVSAAKALSLSDIPNCAINVMRSTRERQIRGSVRQHVRQNGDEIANLITLKLNVLSAEIQSCGTNSRMSEPVVFNAVQLCGLEMAGFADVYDLEVHEEHEFFANGVLVHNCRYGLKSYLKTSKTPLSVLRAEVAAEYVEDGVIVDPTEHAMAMRRFEAEHRKKNQRRGRWSVR